MSDENDEIDNADKGNDDGKVREKTHQKIETTAITTGHYGSRR